MLYLLNLNHNAFEKNQQLVACSVPPEPVTVTANLLSPAFEPAGKVTPVADTDTCTCTI